MPSGKNYLFTSARPCPCASSTGVGWVLPSLCCAVTRSRLGSGGWFGARGIQQVLRCRQSHVWPPSLMTDLRQIPTFSGHCLLVSKALFNNSISFIGQLGRLNKRIKCVCGSEELIFCEGTRSLSQCASEHRHVPGTGNTWNKTTSFLMCQFPAEADDLGRQAMVFTLTTSDAK